VQTETGMPQPCRNLEQAIKISGQAARLSYLVKR
jgi:hypothetical protein